LGQSTVSQTYSIQDLSREFQVTPRTLRFYEDKGLLAPHRRGATRVYSDRDRVHLQLTLRGKRLGLSLDECKEIIQLYDPESPGDVRQLVLLFEKIRDHRGRLLEQIRDIEATLRAMDEHEARCLSELAAAAS
jgi:DNA-binding transcriptional MerR regulator